MATSTCSCLALAVGRQDERQRGLDDCGAADPCVRSHAGRALFALARDLGRVVLRRGERDAPSLGGRGGGVVPGGGEQTRRRPSEPLRGVVSDAARVVEVGLERAFQLTDGAKRTIDGRLARARSRGCLLAPVTASRCSRAPQPDAILELALGKHHLDRIALVLETGHDNVLERVDAPRRPRDLAGQPPQAELGRRDVEHEIEQPFEGGGGDVDARSRRDEPVPAARARARDPIVLQLHHRNTGDDPERQARRDVTRRRKSPPSRPPPGRRTRPRCSRRRHSSAARRPSVSTASRTPLLRCPNSTTSAARFSFSRSRPWVARPICRRRAISSVRVALSCSTAYPPAPVVSCLVVVSTRQASGRSSEDGIGAAAHLRRLHTPATPRTFHRSRAARDASTVDTSEPFDRFTGKRCPQLLTEKGAFESLLRRMSPSAPRRRSRTFCRRQPRLRRGLSMRATPRLACSTAPDHTSSASSRLGSTRRRELGSAIYPATTAFSVSCFERRARYALRT